MLVASAFGCPAGTLEAGVPMLPVVAQDVAVARQIVVSSWATVATSLALIPVAPMGWIYTLGAVLSGGVFLVEAHRLHHHAVLGSPQAVLRPMRCRTPTAPSVGW